jgi:diacylglycerol kinase (ATP)
MADRRAPAVLRSFNYAFEGVIHVLRTQRNMRIHFAIAAAVLVLAFVYDVTRLELIALMISIAFVLIAEMVNTAVEATIDLSTPSFDPLAKIAKDIARARSSLLRRTRSRSATSSWPTGWRARARGL